MKPILMVVAAYAGAMACAYVDTKYDMAATRVVGKLLKILTWPLSLAGRNR